MDDNEKNVRVRIAPSPTGYLHLGTARTGLFNYLFSKGKSGDFLLRIEDTDLERSEESLVDSIVEGLSWLGLQWDEDILYQSDHFEDYRKVAEKLLEGGRAYWCYCTPGEIEERKKKAVKSKKRWMYDRRCYHLSEEEKEKFEEEGRPKALRFLVPPGKTEYYDLVHGKIERDNSEIEDFVILKSDGSPTYNLAVVVDDDRMEITHVMRGDDHISNTFKQILLYRALDYNMPEFAHLPLILGEDRSKMSKRKDAISVSEYREEGFLPEGLVNYLALLGWSPKSEKEIFSMNELIEEFRIENVNPKPAVFDRDRLEWINGEWMSKLGEEEIAGRLEKYLSDNGVEVESREYLMKVISAMGNRVNKFKDFLEIGYYFFTDDFEYDKEGAEKHFREGLSEKMEKLVERFRKAENFDREELEEILRSTASDFNISAAELIHPVRLGVSGMTFGPGLFTLLEVLGRKRVIRRIELLIDYLEGGKA